jgi:hypothetical protein
MFLKINSQRFENAARAALPEIMLLKHGQIRFDRDDFR